MNRAAFFAIIGLGGAAILIALGVWQTQRLAWKQGVIADIEARIDADPVRLPERASPETDTYLPVIVSGQLSGDYIKVLVSDKVRGAGHRIIAAMGRVDGPFEAGTNPRVMVDLGFAPAGRADLEIGSDAIMIAIGNLQWPQETDSFTPEPDLDANIWFARDVPAMAQALDTAPMLLVMRHATTGPQGIEPMPVDTTRIPNNHLQYAVTWFSLAAIWLAMSVYFIRRTPRPSES